GTVLGPEPQPPIEARPEHDDHRARREGGCHAVAVDAQYGHDLPPDEGPRRHPGQRPEPACDTRATYHGRGIAYQPRRTRLSAVNAGRGGAFAALVVRRAGWAVTPSPAVSARASARGGTDAASGPPSSSSSGGHSRSCSTRAPSSTTLSHPPRAASAASAVASP